MRKRRAPTYHYILTIQWPTENGTSIYTGEGTFNRSGTTRLQAYQEILAATRQEAVGLPVDASVNTVFFSLEPNELT